MAGGNSDYKIAIKIAGELEKSFGSSISAAQKMLTGLGAVGKGIGSTMKIAAGALTAVGAAAGAAGLAASQK